MPDLDEILKEALSLGLRDRAKLAEKLLASLDTLSEEEADRLWADEAERRLKEYRAGRMRAIPADDVAQKAQRIMR
jgi:putative addiction module component (TIGR02574 family)